MNDETKKELTDYIMELYKEGKVTGIDVAIMTDLIWKSDNSDAERIDLRSNL